MSNREMIESYGPSSIAIIGMAGRFPGAVNLARFWENLRDGVESISFFTEEELDDAGTPRENYTHESFVRAGGVLDGVDLFDASFFNYSPREAEVIDPQHRLFLECAWEALESAGYDSENYRGSLGVFGGAALSTYMMNLVSTTNILQVVGIAPTIIANANDFLTTRVSYKLNLRGPSIDLQTACSTSLVAVHVACQNLLNGECHIALAGGVTIINPQKGGYWYQEGGILSPDGHCRAFDAGAKGTVGGNGVGIVVLKRLEDALADGDTIHAVIRGSAVNNDGAAKLGYTAPSARGQAEVIAEAQSIAGVTPETITYIEAHGTATPLGDPIEMQALTQVFKPGTDRKQFCGVGSVKSNLGHTDTAAGVAGLIKTVLALKHRQIPPSLHFERPNPNFDLTDSPFYINSALRDWPASDTPRRAGVSSFGIGGTNAHVVLEEAPPQDDADESRPASLLLLSAKSSKALEAATANLHQYLKENPGLNLADVAYTLQVGRRRFEHRRAVVCRDLQDAVAALEAPAPPRVSTAMDEAKTRPVVFMFPGQGAQYAHMGRGLYESEAVFREHVDSCARLLEPYLGLDLRAVLYPEPGLEEDADRKLQQTHLTQPALFVVEHALAQLWMSWGLVPQAMIGHSIGEYVAACLAGVFSLEDALALVAARGALMQEMPAGAMLATQLSEEELRPLLGAGLSVASVNAPSLTVVAGPLEAVEKLQKRLAQQQSESRLLRTSHAFHSEMMEPVLARFAARVEAVKRQMPRLPFISNVTGTWITDEQATDPQYWARHLRQTVRFADGARELLQKPGTIFLEVGPGQTLGTLLRQQVGKETLRAVVPTLRRSQGELSDSVSALEALGQLWLAGARVDWEGFYASERRRRIPLPTYPFERQRYWLDRSSFAATVTARVTTRGKQAKVADWYYVPVWKQSRRPTRGAVAEPKTYLIFLDECGEGAEIATRLKREGCRVVTVEAGEYFDWAGDNAYTINPLLVEEYIDLFAQLAALGTTPDVVVHTWGLTHGDEFELSLDRSFYSLLYLAQALAGRHEIESVRLCVLSEGAQEVTGDEKLFSAKATAAGLCKVIPQEHPHITCRSIDLSLPDGVASSDLISDLVNEVASDSTEPVVAYRGKHRWTQIFEQAQPPAAPEAHSLLREGGVYMITGGLGRIGLLLAQHLASSMRARLVLVGHSELPARAGWDEWLEAHGGDDEVARRIRAVRALEEAGAEVMLVNADVSDERQMRGAVDAALQRFGALNGVIHAAAGKGTVPLSETGRAQCETHFGPKVRGLLVLERVLREVEPDFCLLLSSLASVLGGLGYAAYSAASAYMDAFASGHHRNSSTAWISVDMDGWRFKEDGSTTPQAELTMTEAEGLEVLQRVLVREAAPRVVISTGDLQTRLEQWVELKALRGSSAADATAFPLHERPAVSSAYVAPATAAEKTVADIWQQLLGIEQVGTDDNFFELGGHSLLATQVVSRLRKAFQVEVPLRSVIEAPTVAGIAQTIERILDSGKASTVPPIVPVPRDQNLPLSFAQQRLWFLDRLEPDNPFYNLYVAFRLTGALNISAAERSLNEVVRRHEALRTTIIEVNGQPTQHIAPSLHLELPVLDLSEVPQQESDKRVRMLAEEEAARPFDLAAGPLVRAKLLRLGDEEHVMLFTMHHIVSDGWSMGILVSEVTVLYAAYASGEESPLPELPIQYADYAAWQRAWLQGDVLEEQLSYWKTQLGGELPMLELPADRPRPPLQSFRGEHQFLSLPDSMSEAIRELSRQEGATLYILLLAAFKALLFRYTGQTDILIGTPSANRNRAETESVIGFFINTIVLRTQFNGELTFRELLGRVREVALGAYAHEDLPFDMLVMELQPERNLSVMPLFQVSFNIYNFPTAPLELPGVKLSPVEADSGAMPFDLILTIRNVEQGMLAGLGYNTDLFDGSTAARMLGNFGRLLEGIIANPDARLSELPLVGEDERQLLREWNQTDADYLHGDEPLLHRLFERQVAREPAAVALVEDGRRLSYAELDAAAGRLAQRLRRAGVQAESRVGVLAERSVEMVVALLGVLKAGAAYVPLEPSYPGERLRLMCEDAGCAVVLAQSSLVSMAAEWTTPVLLLEADEEADSDTAAPSVTTTADNLAYVIYTSGSTGRPKGVMVTHRAIANRVLWTVERHGLGATDRVLFKTPFSFDASIWELFAPLLSGGRVVVARAGGHQDAAYLVEAVREYEITVLQLVPSMLRVVLDEEGLESCVTLRRMFCGGERLTMEDQRRLAAVLPAASLHNLYGPTETAIDATSWDCERGAGRAVMPIGEPIGNLRAYVVDAQLRSVPVGVAGELYVGGVGLARGYLGRPDLTAERFVPDALSGTRGARLYRTGDVARWSADGVLEYVGRADQQVKVRGFRIEPAEVETVIRLQPRVQTAVVQVREDLPGDRRLVAYVVPDRNGSAGVSKDLEAYLTTDELRASLETKLPPYMIPSAFVLLDELPRLPSGKVDMRALPSPDEKRSESEDTLESPVTPVEEVLTGVWRDVLGVNRIGMLENFFELGGHSLLAMQVMSRVRRAFGVELRVRALFESPTLAALAENIARVTAGAVMDQGGATASRGQGPQPTYAQQRLWMLEQVGQGGAAYHLATEVSVHGPLKVAALERAIDELVRRHEALRTVFVEVDGHPLLKTIESPRTQLQVKDLSRLPEAERSRQAQELARQRCSQPFALDAEPLLRAELLKLSEQEYRLLLTTHLLASDEWSRIVMLRELISIYGALVLGRPDGAAEPLIRYADFAHWEREWSQGEAYDAQLQHWLEKLRDVQGLALPSKRARSSSESLARGVGRSRSLVANAERLNALTVLGESEDCTPFMTLLAAWQVLLHHHTGQTDVVTTTDVPNRHDALTKELVGHLTNQLALRTDLSGDPSFRELLRRVREVVLAAYAHQHLPFERVLESFGAEGALEPTPLTQTKIVRALPLPAALAAGGVTFELSPLRLEGARAQADLLLEITQTEQQSSFTLEYDADLFGDTAVEQMLKNLETILGHVVDQPDAPLSELTSVLAAADRQRRISEEDALEQATLKSLKSVRRRAAAAESKIKTL